MAAVQIKRVEKYFGATHIIRGVDIDMEDGQFTVLVGPSGCGKSTLLRMIAGLEEITGGEVLIGGRVVNNMMPKERDIAMVFQNYALYPHMTVRDNMTFSLMLARQPKAVADERVRKAADILGLNDLLDRYPRQLSGGQRQRVAMGRCIVRDPQVFLFDEPLSNLDAKLRVQMRTEIKELHQRLKTTSVYVTHDQIEAMTMADKIVVMRDGIVEQTGSPLEVYDRPANQFVAGFIGSPAMNFLPGVLRRAGGSVRVDFADGMSLPLPASAGGRGRAAGDLRHPARAHRAGRGRRGRGHRSGGGRAHRRRHPGLHQDGRRGSRQRLPSAPCVQARPDDPPAAGPGAGPSVRRRQRRAPGRLNRQRGETITRP